MIYFNLCRIFFDSPISILNIHGTTCALSGVFRRLKRPHSWEDLIQAGRLANPQFKQCDSWAYFRDQLEIISLYLNVYDEG